MRTQQKAKLRADVLGRLSTMTPDERARRSALFGQRIAQVDAWRTRRGALMAYLAFASELDVSSCFWIAWGDGRQVCVPRTDWDRRTITPVSYTPAAPTRVGRHGVPEVVDVQPVPVESLAIILVPGVAFDRDGARLGRGGGFYDRFLSGIHERGGARPVFVGVCFEEQLVDEVPCEGHDMRMDAVVTV